jgi:anti-anti-sigma factor
VHRERSTELLFRHPDIAIVALRGEHDLSTAPQIATALDGGSTYSRMLVDLSQCDFIDSMVISALLRASNRMHTRGARFALVIPDGRHLAIRKIFELMSIERLVPVHTSRADAITDLCGDERAPARLTQRLPGLCDILRSGHDDSEEEQQAA